MHHQEDTTFMQVLIRYRQTGMGAFSHFVKGVDTKQSRSFEAKGNIFTVEKLLFYL
jgi:hypothetical protein